MLYLKDLWGFFHRLTLAEMFSKMKLIFKIFIFLIIFSCKNSETKKVNFEGFSIEIPVKWKQIKLKGVDSYVGGFITQQKDSIIFDFGFYLNSLDTHQKIRDSLFTELIEKGNEYEHSLEMLDSIISTINIDSLSNYEIEYYVIDNKPAKIIFPKYNKTHGSTGVYFDSIWDKDIEQKVRFNLYGNNLNKHNKEQLIKAIKTLKFEK